ncbi:MAG: hypothetical protein HOY79_05100 [Streptomyces sp.]|nr:hypothetical protein [Streptomyces sp.]
MTLDKAADEVRSDDGIEDHTDRAVAMKVGGLCAYGNCPGGPDGAVLTSSTPR